MLSLPALDSTKNSLNSTSSETLTTVRNAYCTQQDSGDREPRPDAGAAGAPHRQATGVPHPTQPKQRTDERKMGNVCMMKLCLYSTISHIDVFYIISGNLSG